MPARRRRTPELVAGAALLLGACSAGSPEVLVARAADGAAEGGTRTATADEDPTAQAAPSEGIRVDGLGLLRTGQLDLAFGTVVNATAAPSTVGVTVLTYDAEGLLLTEDTTTEVDVPAGGESLFVADVVAPEGAAVASLDARVGGAPPAPEPPAVTLENQEIEADPLNPVVSGRLTSGHGDDLTAVRVSAVCAGPDGEPVAAGYGHVPLVPAGASARYEITLHGVTPDRCRVVAAP
ncbi:hypothetical protein [Georgenia sp. AZ-5]|uniref:hypothetical protein n=1 Tax=Georgenia sp. AZ-5 TaxID=3367526 RepID=UPI00375494BF